MELTTATGDDVEDIVELWVALARSQRAHGSHLLPAENRTAIRESIARHVVADSLLIAREPDIVGFVMYRVEESQFLRDVNRGSIENVFVVPDRRGEGIGSALLEAAEADLAARGADTVILEVMAANERAQRFYEEHGYESHRIEYAKELDVEE